MHIPRLSEHLLNVRVLYSDMNSALIILDTNFLLIPLEFGVDVFQEIERIFPSAYELGIVEGTINEVESIMIHGRGKDKEAARVGKSLIVQKKMKILPMEGYYTVDEALVHWGKKGAIVATQDKDLKRALKSLRIPRIVLRKKSYLLLEGEIRCIMKQK